MINLRPSHGNRSRSVDDPRHRASAARLRELCRMREVLLDYLVGPNEFDSTERNLQRYFDVFAVAATRRPRDVRGEESAPQR